MARPVYNGGLPDEIEVAQGQYDVDDTIYTVPSGTFTDPDGDDLYYDGSFEPSWLGFTDNGTDQFFYLKQAITAGEIGITTAVRLMAMDPGYSNTSAYIDFTATAGGADGHFPMLDGFGRFGELLS